MTVFWTIKPVFLQISLSLQQQATLDRETGGLIFISSLLLPAAGIRMQEPGQFI